MNNTPTPVVFCHGLFGWGESELGGYPYFFCVARLRAQESDELPPFLFPATGPVSSLHDQACELFYELKGGLVNFGREHSVHFGHAQFSRDYTGKGLYPSWDESHPLDFVAHSMGAPVVRMLQYLLTTGFFSLEDSQASPSSIDYKTSSLWIRSLTTVAGVHNGSNLTWLLGASEETGRVKKNAYFIKIIGSLLEKYAALQTKYSTLGTWYDLRLEQWGIENGEAASISIRSLLDNSHFIESEDCALYDLTPNAMEKWNPLLKEYTGTWYFSYVTRSTFSLLGIFELPLPYFTHFFLIPFAMGMGHYRSKSKNNRENKNTFSHANDGMCPSSSQDSPHSGSVSRKIEVAHKKKMFRDFFPETGIWYVQKRFKKTDHAEIAMLPHFFRIKSGITVYRSIIQTILEIRKKS